MKQYEAIYVNMYTIGISKIPPPPPLTIEFYAAVPTVYSCKDLESVTAGTLLCRLTPVQVVARDLPDGCTGCAGG